VFFLDPATVEGMTLPTPAARTTERLVSHPTRGVFAEAKLGHCNASEFIDDRRFWDWQKSPIPDAAEATPSLSGRSSDPVTSAPTLATPGVTIVNPAAAPDPSGLVAVIAATLKEGAFRDTSMAGEVGGAVKSALDGATEAVTTPIPGTPTEEKPKDPKTPDPKVPDPKVPDPKVSDPKVPDPKPKAGDVLSPTGTHAGHTTPTPKQPATTTYGNTRAFKQVTVVVARDASVEVLALASVELRNAAGGQQRASLIDASEVSFDNVPASWTQVSVILNDLKLRQWGNRSDTPMLSIPNGWRADVSLGSGRTKIRVADESGADLHRSGECVRAVGRHHSKGDQQGRVRCIAQPRSERTGEDRAVRQSDGGRDQGVGRHTASHSPQAGSQQGAQGRSDQGWCVGRASGKVERAAGSTALCGFARGGGA
jgi:hypothetical protein